MEFISKQNYLRMSPRKIRPVVALIKKLTPIKAVETLPFIGKRASVPLRKVIMTALANAKDKGVSESDLVFKEIQINEGPRLKRGLAISRGRWHPIKKRMSHIKIILETKTPEVIKETKPKEDISENSEELKIKVQESKLQIKNKKGK